MSKCPSWQAIYKGDLYIMLARKDI
jgi:hypothetical protein